LPSDTFPAQPERIRGVREAEGGSTVGFVAIAYGLPQVPDAVHEDRRHCRVRQLQGASEGSFGRRKV
jgi:hypothetical protein